MTRLILRLFGLPRIEIDGNAIVTDRRKAQALLIYLAVNGLDYSRETLATLLWPDQDTSHALAYLRRTLWEINQTFGPGWVRTERDVVGLHPDARPQMWIDVSRFRTLVFQSRERDTHRDLVPLLDEAVMLYQDHFLAGFNLKDASLFDEWVSTLSESLKRDFFLSLESLARIHARRGQVNEALVIAARWVEQDALNEAAHGLLMELYARNGQVSAVLRQYQECARILERELGVSPSAETQKLFERFKQDAGKKAAEPAPGGDKAPTRQSLPDSAYPTSFFGRRSELAELEKLLRDPSIRLVTILGPGGAGKTRLALEAGRINSLFFEHGACFVPLASVSQPEYVISAIANALGLEFVAAETRSQPEQLGEFLAGKNLLIILDNLEHLLAVPNTLDQFLESLLKTAPRLTLLATSHERLNLQQEWVLNVQGMPVPASDALDWEHYGAVQLFIQNARKAAGTLRLTEADRRAIIRICHLVGGLPLGLELAATWAKMLSCEEIAREIERSLDFLKTPLKNVVGRHQSLRATFEYSWTFLSEAEKLAFSRLAVFHGGFGREAAQAVAQAPLGTLSELVDKSLIQRDDSGRFDIHQALKPFALEKLALDETLQARATESHGQFFAAFMQERMWLLRGHGQRKALDEMTTELDNILVGWRWAIAHGGEPEVQAYIEALYRYFEIRSRLHDAEQLFGQAVEVWQQRKGTENATYGLLLACHGWFCNRISRITRAHQLLLQSLDLLRRLNARPQLMFVISLALYVVPMMNDMAEVDRIAQESLAFYQEQNDRWGMAQILPFFHRMKGPAKLQEAIRLHNETLQIYRETGDSAGLGATYNSLGELFHYVGDFENARRCHQSGLEIARELNDRRAIAASLDYLGYINRQLGEFELARSQHQASMEISQELDDQLGVAGSLDNLGMIALDQHNDPEAARLFQLALPLRRSSGQTGSVALSLEHVASAALNLNDLSLAETCLQESLVIYSQNPEWALSSRANSRLSDLQRLRGDLPAALATCQAALREAIQQQSHLVILDCALRLSWLSAALGQTTFAVALAAFVEQHPASEFALRRDARQHLGNLSPTLTQATFSDAVLRGKTAATIENLLEKQ